MIEQDKLKAIIEAALLAAGEPLPVERLLQLFDEEERPSVKELCEVMAEMEQDYEDRSFRLKEIASGYCFQVKQDYAHWITRLWEEKPPRYSRALLETLAIIAYRQPLTRAEIEDVRGVAVSSNIMRTLLERDWVKLLGHRDVPGKPGIYGTNKQFLNYFNLKSLDELPTLAEVKDLDKMVEQLDTQLELSVEPTEETDQAGVLASAEVELETTEKVIESEVAETEQDDSVISEDVVAEAVMLEEALESNEDIAEVDALDVDIELEEISSPLDDKPAEIVIEIDGELEETITSHDDVASNLEESI